MAKKQIVSNKTAESAPVSPLIVDNVDALKARMAEVSRNSQPLHRSRLIRSSRRQQSPLTR